MSWPRALLFIVLALTLAGGVGESANSQTGLIKAASRGFVLTAFPPSVVSAGQQTYYTILFGNTWPDTTANTTTPSKSFAGVVVKVSVLHQKIDTNRLSTKARTSLPYKLTVLPASASVSVAKIPPQGTVHFFVYSKVNAGVTGKLCGTKVEVTIGGKLVITRTLACTEVV